MSFLTISPRSLTFASNEQLSANPKPYSIVRLRVEGVGLRIERLHLYSPAAEKVSTPMPGAGEPPLQSKLTADPCGTRLRHSRHAPAYTYVCARQEILPTHCLLPLPSLILATAAIRFSLMAALVPLSILSEILILNFVLFKSTTSTSSYFSFLPSESTYLRGLFRA